LLSLLCVPCAIKNNTARMPAKKGEITKGN
jgi:hypothetical protein